MGPLGEHETPVASRSGCSRKRERPLELALEGLAKLLAHQE
jgi:hypothetical protein